jgi:FkbM family methyltransferase
VEACRGKTSVLDVGANVGLVTLPMSSVMARQGRIWAFEPAATNAALLRRHLALNGVTSVSVVEAVVGEADGTPVAFFEREGPDVENSMMLYDERGRSLESRGYSQVMHRQVSLDAFCARENIAPEVIKIDVEGGEVRVLRGARDVLQRHRPIIILSVHPHKIELAGDRIEALRSLIAELGYEVRTPEGEPVHGFALDEYIVAPRAQC